LYVLEYELDDLDPLGDVSMSINGSVTYANQTTAEVIEFGDNLKTDCRGYHYKPETDDDYGVVDDCGNCILASTLSSGTCTGNGGTLPSDCGCWNESGTIPDNTYDAVDWSSYTSLPCVEANCVDCAGNANGGLSVDFCGDCGGSTGDGENMAVCSGTPYDYTGATGWPGNSDRSRVCLCAMNNNSYPFDTLDNCVSSCDADICFGGGNLDSCGICDGPGLDAGGCCFDYVESETEYTLEIKDCNGECGGTAYIDDCDNCVGGSTGLEEDYAKDACGSCDGDCQVCTAEGVPLEGCPDIDYEGTYIPGGDNQYIKCDTCEFNEKITDCRGICLDPADAVFM
jgi:hypothetical protein